MQYFKIKNWEKFQHYKDRNPPWIKLHNQLLDNYEFENLSDATKGHLFCIWMLASRTSNKMPQDQAWIKRKIGANTTVDLKSLESSGFIELQDVEQDASKVLVSEEERRGEAEERREEFQRVWNIYEKHGNKKTSEQRFNKLSTKNINLLLQHIPRYVKSTPDKQYRKGLDVYINKKCWNDEIIQRSNNGERGYTLDELGEEFING